MGGLGRVGRVGGGRWRYNRLGVSGSSVSRHSGSSISRHSGGGVSLSYDGSGVRLGNDGSGGVSRDGRTVGGVGGVGRVGRHGRRDGLGHSNGGCGVGSDSGSAVSSDDGGAVSGLGGVRRVRGNRWGGDGLSDHSGGRDSVAVGHRGESVETAGVGEAQGAESDDQLEKNYILQVTVDIISIMKLELLRYYDS